MSTRKTLRALPLAGLFPGLAAALGLGDIHLQSNLNAPLRAQIDLVSIGPGDLSGLKASLASRDAFAKAGLDFPASLGTVTVTVGKSADGRDVLSVASAENAVEPFATLLFEVNWARGRLLREYTVLLDPPVFTGQNAPAPVAAPSVAQPAQSGEVQRPSAAAESLPTQSLPEPAGGSYTVRAGDSLSAIIARQGIGGGAREAALLAAFRANPAAFDGNMNLLRAGAQLNLPTAAEIGAIDTASARAEVGQQYRAWQQSRGSAGGQGELRLVPPGGEAAGGTGAGAVASGAGTAALQQRVNSLESELTETKRLLALKNEELARLQAKAGTAITSTTPAPPVGEQPGTSAGTGSEPLPAIPAVEPMSAEPTAAPPKVRVPVAASEAPKSGSWYDGLLDYWYVLAGALALVLGVLGLRAWRARQTEDFDRSLDRLTSHGFPDDSPKKPATSQTMPLRTLPDTSESSIVVEESGTHVRPKLSPDVMPAAAAAVQVDDTVSATGAVSLDQGDPLAEADFHMAYGLYDQAADLVRLAIGREPGRRDLKLKLLEVYFVWGNKEEFLTVARELAASRDQSPPGEWEKILIMGRQIAPDDALFASAGDLHGAGRDGVDLNLEGGQNRVDFDLHGEPTVAPVSSDPLDLDLNAVLGESKVSTAEVARLSESGVDFVLDDPSRGTAVTGSTREMPEALATPTVTVDIDQMAVPEAPTVEQPRPSLDSLSNQTIRQKLDATFEGLATSTDRTTEVPIDDLGLDLGKLESTLGEVPLTTSEVDAREVTRRAAADRGDTSEMTAISPTASGTWMFNDNELDMTAMAKAGSSEHAPTQQITMITPAPKLGDTAAITKRIKELDTSAGAGLDPGSPTMGLASSAIQRAANGQGLDLDVGARTHETEGPFASTQRLATSDTVSDLEPVTLSEVGTKLDLARAYMDMGDPEGARSILDEVLSEGSVSQKQEAKRLMESLPG